MPKSIGSGGGLRTSGRRPVGPESFFPGQQYQDKAEGYDDE